MIRKWLVYVACNAREHWRLATRSLSIHNSSMWLLRFHRWRRKYCMLTNSSGSSCTLPDSMRSASSSISAVSHLLETSLALPPERAITRARSAARTNASAFTTSSSTSATFKNEDCLVDEWHVVDTNVHNYDSTGAGEFCKSLHLL